MGNYASNHRQNLQKNREVIRKYIDSKAQDKSMYTFSSGFDTKVGSKDSHTDRKELTERDRSKQQHQGRGSLLDKDQLDQTNNSQDFMNIRDDQTILTTVSQKYGHDKSINKKQVKNVFPKSNQLEFMMENDPLRALTTTQKLDHLEKIKQHTNSKAVERVEQELAHLVAESQQREKLQRQMVRDSILDEFEHSIKAKTEAKNNSAELKQQLRHQIDSLKQEIKADIECDLELNRQFEKDETLRCAFPRIHAPTEQMLTKERKKQQKVLCDQYDTMLKEQTEIRAKEQAQDKEQMTKEVERVEKAAQERDKKERDNQKKVNEACVKEWELRLRAKDFLRKVRRNTVRQLNMIVQDGSMQKQRAKELSSMLRPGQVKQNKFSSQGFGDQMEL